ncbi:TPA: hypothetical protein ACL8ZI_001284, partial [Streptococcus pneumoniae]
VLSLFIIGHMGLFFYTKISSIISIVDLPTTNIIEPKFLKLYVFIRGKIRKALQIGLSVHLKPDKSSYRRR